MHPQVTTNQTTFQSVGMPSHSSPCTATHYSAAANASHSSAHSAAQDLGRRRTAGRTSAETTSPSSTAPRRPGRPKSLSTTPPSPVFFAADTLEPFAAFLFSQEKEKWGSFEPTMNVNYIHTDVILQRSFSETEAKDLPHLY